jgi:hypothetical protein
VTTIGPRIFTPHDIVLQDDALHRKGSFGHIETWHYGAIFDNNYSIVTLVNVIHMGYLSIVLAGLSIYKDTKLVKRLRSKNPYKCFYGSEKEPLIKINDQQIIKGYINKDTKRWIYQISMGDDKQGVDLEFIKITKAWKGKTFLGDWLVIPRFEVNGRIFLDRDTVSVSGEGYHDHNIYPIYASLTNKGYHFGKIPIDSMNITWARVTKNRTNEELIVILNKNQEYISITPRDVRFTIEKHVMDHGKRIPTTCCLNVENDLLHVDVKMESINFHHLSIPTVNYWRHHVRNTGTIQIDSVSKKIDNIEISEYVKFL